MLIGHVRDGTLIFKDLIIPQWWLDWIIPLASFIMALQALEMLTEAIRSPAGISHEASEHVPGIRAEEMP
jgi:TRAP-type C4-dicarboxylate transport system permease small subunit